MHSGETETIEKPVVKTTQKSAPDNFAATPTTIATFADRHIAPSAEETVQMLRELGFENLDALVDATVPKNIRLDRTLDLPKAKSENEAHWRNCVLCRRKIGLREISPARAIPTPSRRR